MTHLRDSYEVEYWNSKETADRLNNNTYYHCVIPIETLTSAENKFSDLLKNYEFVILKIVKRHVLKEYSKTIV